MLKVEVAHAIKCANDYDVKVCMHSEGHNHVGDSSCDSMLVDTHNLKGNVTSRN